MGKTAFFGRSWAALGAALLFGCAVSGCAGSDQLKKQVASLETQLTAVRADSDRLEERLAALELASTIPTRPAAAHDSERVDHPRLKVIHLSPEDEASAATEPSDESSTSPSKASPSRRPIIRGTGDRVIKEGDESSRNEESSTAPVAELRRESHRN